jgi:hypothetical protein
MECSALLALDHLASRTAMSRATSITGPSQGTVPVEDGQQATEGLHASSRSMQGPQDRVCKRPEAWHLLVGHLSARCSTERQPYGSLRAPPMSKSTSFDPIWLVLIAASLAPPEGRKPSSEGLILVTERGDSAASVGRDRFIVPSRAKSTACSTPRYGTVVAQLIDFNEISCCVIMSTWRGRAAAWSVRRRAATGGFIPQDTACRTAVASGVNTTRAAPSRREGREHGATAGSTAGASTASTRAVRLPLKTGSTATRMVEGGTYATRRTASRLLATARASASRMAAASAASTTAAPRRLLTVEPSTACHTAGAGAAGTKAAPRQL